MTEETVDADVLAVEELIAKRRGVTFVEIGQLIEGRGIAAKGDLSLLIKDYNVVLWTGMSERFLEIVMAMQARKRVIPKPTSVLVYAVDGVLLTLPLAKRNRRYKTPHWVPTVFDPRP